MADEQCRQQVYHVSGLVGTDGPNRVTHRQLRHIVLVFFLDLYGVIYGTFEEPMIPKPIDEIEQASPKDAEEGDEGRELDTERPKIEARFLVKQEPDGGEEGEKDCDKHASNSHADVIEMLLHLNDSFPNFDDFFALFGLHYFTVINGNP